MHDTLSPNFHGHVDNFYVDNGNLVFSGWITTTHKREEVIYFIDVGHEVAFYNFNERQDVADFYSTTDTNYKNSGFNITIPHNGREEYQVYALVRGQKEVIFNLSLAAPTLTVDSGFVSETFNIKIRDNLVPDFLVVDNFYSNPDEVRALALQQDYAPDLRYHKGQRTDKRFFAEGTKQIFESLLGRKITNWTTYNYNGIFQYCNAEDALVYHSDLQSYAAVVYLTPDAPPQCGTSFFRSKHRPDIRKCHYDDPSYNDVFKGGFYDKTKFELVDVVGNVYNRLAMWDAKLIHAATEYFGKDKTDSRLFHLFFFDIE